MLALETPSLTKHQALTKLDPTYTLCQKLPGWLSLAPMVTRGSQVVTVSTALHVSEFEPQL